MAPRLIALEDNASPEKSRKTLAAVSRALGMAPNLHRTLAHAPAALDAYVKMATSLAGGGLDPRLRESIAIATAVRNGCTYCASAHSLLGRKAGLTESEISQNLERRSEDSKTSAVLQFVAALLDDPRSAGGSALNEVREAGFTDGEIVEIVTHVGMNAFTNMFNELADTEIDFPVVQFERVS